MHACIFIKGNIVEKVPIYEIWQFERKITKQTNFRKNISQKEKETVGRKPDELQKYGFAEETTGTGGVSLFRTGAVFGVAGASPLNCPTSVFKGSPARFRCVWHHKVALDQCVFIAFSIAWLGWSTVSSPSLCCTCVFLLVYMGSIVVQKTFGVLLA